MIDSTVPVALTYGIDSRPGTLRTIVLGLQHVLVMFTAMVGSPLIIARSLQLTSSQTALMVSGCMLGCGLGTVLAAMGRGWLGGRLPLVLGVFAVFIGPCISIARTEGLDGLSGAMLLGGLLVAVSSQYLARARALLPPVVLGTVLLVTGASLLRIAAGLLTSGPGRQTGLGLLTLALIVVISSIRGTGRTLAVFISLVTGYAIAALAGLIDFSALAGRPLVSLPSVLPFGLAMPSGVSLFTVLACYLAASVETAVQAITVASICGVIADRRRIGGAIAADGAGSVCSVLFGGLPLTSYSQNIGAITLTGVGSRIVVAAAGAMLVALSCLPSLALTLSLTPAPVLGGALLFLFGIIAVLGMRTCGSLLSHRDRIIVAVSLALGLGVSFVSPQWLLELPSAVRPFASDGIIVGMITSIILNLTLPAVPITNGRMG